MRPHVSKLGPIDEDGTCLYWASFDGAPPTPTTATSDREGLEKVLSGTGARKGWTCDPQLEDAGRAMGLEPAEPTPEADLLRLTLAVGFGAAESVVEAMEGTEALLAVITAAGRFGKAKTWRDFVGKEFLVLSTRDDEETEYTAIVMSDEERTMLTVLNDDEELSVVLEEDDQLSDAMEHLTGQRQVPLLMGGLVTDDDDEIEPVGLEGVRMLCGVLEAFATLDPESHHADARCPGGGQVALELHEAEDDDGDVGELEEYDPQVAPPPEAWLALSESEQLELVAAGIAGEKLPKKARMLHVSFHVVAENQLAMKLPEALKIYAKELKRTGDRHSAVHAVGAKVAGEMFELMKKK